MEQIKLKNWLFHYDRSIYDEGDVQIISQTEVNYILEDGRLYRTSDHGEVLDDSDRVLHLFNDALGIVSTSIK